MTASRARILATGVFAACVALSLAAGAFLFLARSIPSSNTEFGPKWYLIAFTLVVGAVGAVVAARVPSNPIGWIFCVDGIVAGVLAFATEYARWGLYVEHGKPVGAVFAGWFPEWAWMVLTGSLGLVAAIFPNGRFRTRAWRRAILISLGLAVVGMVLAMVTPRFTIFAGFDNPFGLGGKIMTGVSAGGVGLLLPLVVLGAASAIGRFRGSHGEERQQLKWLALAVTLLAGILVVYGSSLLILGTAEAEALTWAEPLAVGAFLGVPVSIAFGVLKYRLYDIDVVINKAVVYGSLAVFITVVYVGIVAGVGAVLQATSNAVLSAVAAATIALAFQPARRWAQRIANRLVYGERATPYEVLADLGERLAGGYASDDVLDRMAASLAGGIGADLVVVWLSVGPELRPGGLAPKGEAIQTVAIVGSEVPDEIAGMRTFPVLHDGELLGAISLRKPSSDPISPADEELIQHLAGQAGLVLRNARLIEDLRASRQRLVAAQDAERRKIERNIHDGAQQQLVALSIKIRLADGLVGKDDSKVHEVLGELQSDSATALEDLRALAHGIYPPLLADKGLAAALESQARKSPLPVTVAYDGVGRFPRDTEAAVYFCVLEALQNVSKYANATAVEVQLSEADGSLRFSVRDDGAGFDPASAGGSGLVNMRDRLDALGGSLEIDSAPGQGATLSGEIPVA